MPSNPAQAVTPAAMATSWMPRRKPDGEPAPGQGRPRRRPRWLAEAAAIHSRPTSGPVTSRATAMRRAWLAAISARKPSATWADPPNSRMAASAAWAGGSPADRCASAASSSPERNSATMPARARSGQASRAVTSAR